MLIDIPVEPADANGNTYLPQLPDKTWDTILEAQIMPYMVTPDGNMYLGTEHTVGRDADGHQLITIDDKWANISGQLVCYESESSMETEEGIVFKGTVKARLNGVEKVTLHVEWDPVRTDKSKSGDAETADSAGANSAAADAKAADAAADADADAAAADINENGENLTGRVIGYSRDAENRVLFMNKGLEKLRTGDTVEFMFDYYDDEGKLVKTGSYGSAIHILSEDGLNVTNEAFDEGTELSYYGVLTDVYQRNLITEAINKTVE
jgi:hypothetical protein